MSAPVDTARVGGWSAAGLGPEEFRALCARIAVTLNLDYNDDLHHLTSLFRYSETLSVGRVREAWRSHLAEPRSSLRGIGLYLHVPFCEALCSFCFCPTSVPDKADKLESYAESVIREIDYFAPIFAGRAFQSFFVGGGSPSLLSAQQLRRTLGRCAKRFTFEPGALLSIEANPKSTDPDKLAAMREAGFNRISFGVQSMNPRVLESINRAYQTEEMVAAAVEEARRAGFDEINLDFLLGLQSDDERSFLDTFRRVARLRPTTLTVCGLSLTEGYVRSNRLDRGSYEAKYEELIARMLEPMGKAAAEEGYRCDWLVPQSGSWVFMAEDCPRPVLERMERCYSIDKGPSSIFGLGPHSQSRVFGGWLYERSGTSKRDFTEDEGVYLARPVSLKQEMMRHILYTFEIDSGLPRAPFQEMFGVDPLEPFQGEFAALEALGQVRILPDRIDFLPQGAASRYVHSMMLLRDILHELPLSAQGFRKQRLEAGL